MQAESLGLGSLARVIVPHPLGGASFADIAAKAAAVVDEVERLATTPGDTLTAEHYAHCTLSPATPSTDTTNRILVPQSYEGMSSYLEERGLGDGLPVVPPTEARVATMLTWTDRDASEIVGKVAPNNAPATVEKVAANAVMAGCKPQYFPLVLAAVEAVTQPEFNLLGIQATTHPTVPLIVFNGPLGREAGVHSGAGLFGSGFPANATIGRALRLVLLNIGGGIPVTSDKSTHGHPGKFSYCIAENEEDSPWAPRHVDLGYPLDASTITVIPGEAPHNIHDSWSTSAASLLTMFTRSITQLGSNNSYGLDPDMLLVIGPEHAATFAHDGVGKPEIQQYVFEHATIPMSLWPPEFPGEVFATRFPEKYLGCDIETTMVPMLTAPEKLMIIVAGGVGKHSMHVPTLGTPSLVRPITLKSGEYAKSLHDFTR